MKLDRWIPLAEAAGMAGEPLWRFRRRMHVLNHRHGGRLLRNFSRGDRNAARWHVSAEALLHHLRTDPNQGDEELDEIRGRVDENEQKTEALRQAFRRRSREWYARIERLEKLTGANGSELASRGSR
jgi:hypothetical protein